MAPSSHAALYLLLLLTALPAAAQEGDLSGAGIKDKVTAGASQMGEVKAKDVPPRQVREDRPEQYARLKASVLKAASDRLTQDPTAGDVAAFINDHGCVDMGHGKKAAMTAAVFKKLVQDTARHTEVIFILPKDMDKLAGAGAKFFGITKELKAGIKAQRNIEIGRDQFNTIAEKAIPEGPDQPLSQDEADGQMGALAAHELLHIVFRQVNEELGGGSRLTDLDPAIPNLHHTMTAYLGWGTRVAQPWIPPAQRNPPAPAPACSGT